jgi:hypothetical protein
MPCIPARCGGSMPAGMGWKMSDCCWGMATTCPCSGCSAVQSLLTLDWHQLAWTGES